MTIINVNSQLFNNAVAGLSQWPFSSMYRVMGMKQCVAQVCLQQLRLAYI